MKAHAEKLMWLAEWETECPCSECHGNPVTDTCFHHQPGQPAYCEDCGNTGKVPEFPTLRQVCPECEGYRPIRVKRVDCLDCQGRGWVPVDSLGATAKAGWLIFEFQIHPQVEYRGVGDGPVLDYILACAKGDNEAAIAALYEAKKAEVKL